MVYFIHRFPYVELLNVWAKSYLVIYFFNGLLILFVTRPNILLSCQLPPQFFLEGCDLSPGQVLERPLRVMPGNGIAGDCYGSTSGPDAVLDSWGVGSEAANFMERTFQLGSSNKQLRQSLRL